MDPERRGDDSIYDLVTQLVGHTLWRNRAESEKLYAPPRNDVKTIRKLRSKAFEILLNKSDKVYDREARACAQSEIF